MYIVALSLCHESAVVIFKYCRIKDVIYSDAMMLQNWKIDHKVGLEIILCIHIMI